MSSKALRRVTVGLEGTPGVGVAVDTALWALSSSEMALKIDKHVPDEDIGNHGPKRNVIVASGASGKLDMDGVYEQAHVMTTMALGKVAATGGPGAYVWTTPLPTTTDQTPAAFSMEFYGDANHIIRSESVVAEAFEISGQAGKTWQFKNTLAGGCSYYAGGPTGTPALPDPVTSIRMADTRAYCDSLYANIGDTELDGFYNFSLKGKNLQHLKTHGGSEFADGVGVGEKWDISLMLTLEASEATTRALRDKLLTEDTVAIRIEAISGGLEARIDLSAMAADIPSLKDIKGDNTLEINLKGQVDSLGNAGEVEIVNTTNVL